MMKSANFDEEAVMAVLEELEDLKGQFQDAMNELIGKSPMPGIQAAPGAGGLDTRTCNMQGVELPGSCEMYNQK